MIRIWFWSYGYILRGIELNNFELLKPSNRCPKCKTEGALDKADDGFVCSSCKDEYSILEGIPRFVPAENYANSFGFQWNLHSKTQMDKFNGTTVSRDRLYSESHWTPEQLTGKDVLECGSGCGRFTQALVESGANTYTIDYSSAVDANLINNGDHSNLLISQASIYDLPFKENYFDFLLCIGVIQHTPDPLLSLTSMLKHLKVGGKFCFDVYASPISYLHPRHLFRPITKRVKKETLYKIIEVIMPPLFVLSTILHKIPFVGQLLARLVPVANWRANIKLKDESMYYQWSLLDTFDWYSPAFEKPQSKATIEKHLNSLGLKSFEVERVRGLLVIRGTK